MMKTYEVSLERTYSKAVIVKANSEEEAMAKVYKSREGDYTNYVDCIGINVGYAEEIKGENT